MYLKPAFFTWSVIWALAGFTANADNPIPNPSFEAVGADGNPAGWNITYRLVDAKMAVAPSPTAAEGNRVFRIQRKTPYTENVYGKAETFVPVKPGVRYRISLLARGTGDNYVTLVIGRKWDIRYRIVPDRFWRRNVFEFTLKPDQILDNGTIPLVLTCEDVTAGVELDDLQFSPAEAVPDVVGTPLPPEKRSANGVYLSAAPGTPESAWPVFTFPSGASQWEGGSAPSPRNLKAEVSFLWDDSQGIKFKIRVIDNVVNALSGNEMWRGDSVQMRIEPAGKCGDGVGDDDLELGFSPTTNGVSTWCWERGRALTPEEAEVTAKCFAGGYELSGILHWNLFPAFVKDQGFFSFNMIVNDSDVPGRQERSVAFLAPGIHHEKTNLFNTLFLKGGKNGLVAIPRIAADYTRVVCDWFATGDGASGETPFRQRITDRNGTVTSLPELRLRSGQLVRYTAEYDLKNIAEGPLTISAETGDGWTGICSAKKSDPLQDQIAAMAQFRKRLRSLCERAAKDPASAVITMYERVADLQIERFDAILHRKLSTVEKQNVLKHGETIMIPELTELLNRFEAIIDSRKDCPLPENWTMITSEQHLVDGWPTAVMRSDRGTLEERKVYLGGYGHSACIKPEMQDFSAMGANLIDLETGPGFFFPAEGANGEFSNPVFDMFNQLAETMTAAKADNLRTMFLISPHYAPQWWYEKHPEAKGICGFAAYEINHPETRKMISAYLDVLLPRLAQSSFRDSIFSICLTNEPNYSGGNPAEEPSQRRFAAYLRKTYGTIAELNRRSGRNFADFEAASKTAVADPAMRVQFEKWRQYALLDWHRFLAEKVRHYLPEIPIQTKIMVFFTLDPKQLELGVDPELFSELGDLNGNDNYFYYHPGGTWIADWGKSAFYHDLQWSFKPAAIVNSENHIMPDGFHGELPYGDVYTQAFQQYASGVSGLGTWVWAPYNWGCPEIIHGNIARRPLALVALGQATFDANRLVDELQTLRRAPAEVALLYSQTAYLWNPEGYSTAIRDLHEQLCFTGRPITFLSEKQLMNDRFGDAKLLILPNAKNLDRQAWEGIRRFVAGGGRLLFTGVPPEKDEFDRPLTPLTAKPEELKLQPYPHMNITALERQIASGLRPFSLGIMVDYPAGMQGIYRRTVSSEKGELTNLVNYNNGVRQIRFRPPAGYQVKDLISDRVIFGECTLEPLTPMLLRLEKE